jgi:hypothetical protein
MQCRPCPCTALQLLKTTSCCPWPVVARVPRAGIHESAESSRLRVPMLATRCGSGRRSDSYQAGRYPQLATDFTRRRSGADASTRLSPPSTPWRCPTCYYVLSCSPLPLPSTTMHGAHHHTTGAQLDATYWRPTRGLVRTSPSGQSYPWPTLRATHELRSNSPRSRPVRSTRLAAAAATSVPRRQMRVQRFALSAADSGGIQACCGCSLFWLTATPAEKLPTTGPTTKAIDQTKASVQHMPQRSKPMRGKASTCESLSAQCLGDTKALALRKPRKLHLGGTMLFAAGTSPTPEPP